MLGYVIMRTAVASGFDPDWLEKKPRTNKSLIQALEKRRQLQLRPMLMQKKVKLEEAVKSHRDQEDTVMPSAGPAEVRSPLVPPAKRQRRHSGGPAQDGRGTSLPTAQDGRGTPRLNTQSYHEMDLEEPVMHEQHEHRNRGPGVKLSQRVEQQRQRAQLREQQFHQRLQPHQIDGDGTESSEDSPPGGNEPQQGAPVDAAATARRSLPWERKPQQAAPVAAAATARRSLPWQNEPRQAGPVSAAATI